MRHNHHWSVSSSGVVLSSLVVLFFVGGCVDQKLVARLERAESGLNDLRALQAEDTSRLQSFETSLRSLQGKVEELEFAQNRRLGGALTELQRGLSSLERRVPPPAIVPAATLEADEALPQRLPLELGPKLSDALMRVREGKFDEAVPRLQEGLSLSNNIEYGAVFAFWLGVAFEGMVDNPQALTAYSEFTGRFRKSTRAPMALLRQAALLARLNDTKAAKLTLQKLIADYPKSPEASQARSRLKEIS